MRVISGKYRGKILKDFEFDTTKPTTDRVKESIFNLIQFDVADAVVLDLFAGTGALGIEAISRGAKRVYLVDANSNAIKLIKDNLKGIEGDCSVNQIDFKDFLNLSNNKFDIVLLDPPYATNFGLEAIKLLIKNDLINDGGIIIFETSESNNIEINMPGFEVTKKKYGKIMVFKMVKTNEIYD